MKKLQALRNKYAITCQRETILQNQFGRRQFDGTNLAQANLLGSQLAGKLI